MEEMVRTSPQCRLLDATECRLLPIGQQRYQVLYDEAGNACFFGRPRRYFPQSNFPMGSYYLNDSLLLTDVHPLTSRELGDGDLLSI